MDLGALSPEAHPPVDALRILKDYLRDENLPELNDMLREEVDRFFECVEFNAGEYIFEIGQPAHSIYLIQEGIVVMQQLRGDAAKEESRSEHDGEGRDGVTTTSASAGVLSCWQSLRPGQQGVVSVLNTPPQKKVKYCAGGVFGEMDFILRQPRSTFAIVWTPKCRVHRLRRKLYDQMASESPVLHQAVTTTLLKSMSMEALQLLWN